MQCPECQGSMRYGKPCPACGYEVGQPEKKKRAEWKRCSWTTGEKQCRMFDEGGGRCGWHTYWARLVDRYATTQNEEQVLADWLLRKRPGAVYGHNPGQWWSDFTAVWNAVQGLMDQPVLTKAFAHEIRLRHNEIVHHQLRLPRPARSDDRPVNFPLPPYKNPYEQVHTT